MAVNNLTGMQVHYKNLLPANIEVKLSKDTLAHDLLNTTAPICWSCKSLCKEAYITNHPCTICSECRNKCLQDLEEGKEVNCPCEETCGNTKLVESQLQSQNYLYEKKFDAIKFFRPNEKFGCDLQFSFQEIEYHVENTCNFDQRSCGFCGVKVMKYLLSDHEENECERRLVACDLCLVDVEFKDKDSSHKDIKNEDCCKNFLDTCPYCNDVNVTRDQFIEHLKECIAKPRFCCFKDIGCEFFDNESAVEEHEASNQFEHQKMLLTSVHALKIENESLREKLFDTEETMKKEVENLRQELAAKDDVFYSILTQIDQLKFSSTSIGFEMLEIALEGNLYSVTVQEYNQRYWILREINRRRSSCTDAVEYSPIWSTEFSGYNFTLTLYLNGYGSKKGTHVSLFLQLVPGEYDDNLEWPCPLKFVIEVVKRSRIYDLSPAHVTISWDKAPDESMAAFNRPTSEGILGLGGLTILTQKEAFAESSDYVKNDMMVFRVTYK